MRLIALEGADGTGKTTQARLLVDRLSSMGFRATYVRPVFLMLDPWKHGGTKLAEVVSPRRRRFRTNGKAWDRHQTGASLAWILAGFLGYLYAMAFYGLLRARYRREEFVVCDRFFYQFFYDLYGANAVKLARAFPRPDILVWLDGTTEAFRVHDRENGFEEQTEYLESVSEMLRTLERDLRFHRLDAQGDMKDRGEAIWRIVMGTPSGCCT